MTHATYVGDNELLKGKTALLQRFTATTVDAQFDDLTLPEEFTHGWKTYKASDFENDSQKT